MTTIQGSTQFLGVIGDPISHSKSPLMQNQLISSLGLDFVYLPFHVRSDDLGAAIAGLKALNCKGINVTIPHKTAVIPFLDRVDDFAKKVGAVNTIIFSEEGAVGYNTDGLGFIRSTESETGLSFTQKEVTVLGAGGSAKAIMQALLDANIACLNIGARNQEKAEKLMTQLSSNQGQEINFVSLYDASDDLNRCLSNSSVIINTTPLGMSPKENEAPLSRYDWVTEKHVCVDIIYAPDKTLFLREAENKGATILNGLGMLAMQGALAFEKFTGKTVDYHDMKKGLLK